MLMPPAVVVHRTAGLPRRCGAPTAWTVLQNDDADHLGMRCNALPEHQMALITSDHVPFSHDRRPPSAVAVLQRRRCGAPTTWTVLQQHGPNHLGMRCNALPGHQMALITSGCAASAGLCHLGLGWPEQATEYFSRAIHAAPEDPRGYRNRATANRQVSGHSPCGKCGLCSNRMALITSDCGRQPPARQGGRGAGGRAGGRPGGPRSRGRQPGPGAGPHNMDYPPTTWP